MVLNSRGFDVYIDILHRDFFCLFVVDIMRLLNFDINFFPRNIVDFKECKI